MSVLDLRATDAVVVPPCAVDAPERTRPLRPSRLRLAAAVGLTAPAGAFGYADVFADALDGSLTAYLVVVPVLWVLIAAGHRTPPRGVCDAESDWIVAALIGAAGLTGIFLVANRLPTPAGLWRLPALGTLVWFAVVLTVLFGVRHVVRMWAMWLFALCVGTPLPFLLATAALGGGDAAATVVAAGIGTLAVALATPGAPTGVRLLAMLGCFSTGTAIAGLVAPGSGTLVGAALAAGVVPVSATLITRWLAVRSAVGQPAPLLLPKRSPWSLALLAVVAATLMLHPFAGQRTFQPAATGDWGSPETLGPATDYPFISRFLGPGSRLQRYRVPTAEGRPAAAVDVISTSSAAALRDLADAVWYPSERPLNYRPGDPSMPLGSRIIHSDADAATTGADAPWYAVTWPWSTGAEHRQVTVIVSQARTGTRPPPEPEPLSVSATGLQPALWLARQQPDDVGAVDELVRLRAVDLATRLVTAVEHRGGRPADA